MVMMRSCLYLKYGLACPHFSVVLCRFFIAIVCFYLLDLFARLMVMVMKIFVHGVVMDVLFTFVTGFLGSAVAFMMACDYSIDFMCLLFFLESMIILHCHISTFELLT